MYVCYPELTGMLVSACRHFDLLIGDHVAEEVVPHLTEWMAGLDGPLDKGTEVEGRPASTVVAA